MPNVHTPSKQSKSRTEADVQSIDGQSGRQNSKLAKSGKDAASHTKAGSTEGAGGGKKRQRNH